MACFNGSKTVDVGIGAVVICVVAHAKGFAPPEFLLEEVHSHVARVALPIHIRASLRPGAVADCWAFYGTAEGTSIAQPCNTYACKYVVLQIFSLVDYSPKITIVSTT